jgi:hypothetical protein
MNAYTIEINGTKTIVNPKNGKDFKLEELQTLVGGENKCFVEPVYINRKEVVFCDEDGLAKQLPYNAAASRLVGTRVVGKVLVCPQSMVK